MKDLKHISNTFNRSDKDIWVATFQDAGKYIREKLAAEARFTFSSTAITVTLTHSLDPKLYNLPLTVKTFVPKGWKKVKVVQNNKTRTFNSASDSIGNFVIYDAVPNGGTITLSPDNLFLFYIFSDQ